MGYLKTELPKVLAVLTCCGIVAGSSVGFAAFDKSAIQTCDADMTQNSEVDNDDNSVIVKNEMGNITVAETSVYQTQKPVSTTNVSASETTSAQTTQATTSETTTQTARIYYTTKETTQSVTEITPVTTTVPVTTEVETASKEITTQTAAVAKTTTKRAVTTEPEEETTTTKKTTADTAETTLATQNTDETPVTTKATDTTTAKKTTTAVKTTTVPKTTTKKITTTTAASVDNGSTAKSRFNAATLVPENTLTGNESTILKKYMKKIISSDMTNYEKAVACYDYLINNTYYAYGGWSKPVEAVLEDGYGTCTEYSYVLAAMMNYIGFDAKTVDGYTAMAAGGYGYHMWVEVKINGTTYVMDAQVDDNLTWGGVISHSRFVKTYDEVAGKYKK